LPLPHSAIDVLMGSLHWVVSANEKMQRMRNHMRKAGVKFALDSCSLILEKQI
jgi:hypothetical protein